MSPLLANIYLDAWDKELEWRGLSFCRYADDIVLFVSSERSGERILSSLTSWIEKHLKLRVNVNKSGVGHTWEGKSLGFRINSDGRVAPAKASIERFKAQVRSQWSAQESLKLEERIKRWQQYVRGWWNYYKICQQWHAMKRVECWTRRHMRKYFWQRWHNRR
ncbi:MAG: group intron reverse transcriptase/maturase [Pseudomonadota bacterium]